MAHVPYGGDLIGISPDFTIADLELHGKHRSSSDTIARFSNVLSNALNNLLTVTIGYVERAQKAPSNPHQSRNLESARTSADSMSETLLQLQCFANTSSPVDESTCILIALTEALDLIKIQDPTLVVTTVVDQPHRIDANFIETTRMFMNLLNNCVDALGVENRNVNIRIRDITTQSHPLGLEDGDYLVITVSDNGSGITEASLPQIFEPFFSTKDSHEGMGLSWVWGFVNKHRGSIRVRSVVGQGTSFEIFLPFGVNVQRRAAASVTALHPVAHKRILVVEDNAAVLDIIHAAMTNQNYLVTTATAGLEAFRLIKEQEFDLLIVDLTLPGLASGTEVADAMIEEHPCAKILLTTGRLDRQDIAVNSEYHLLIKPFSMEKLTKTVKKILT
jgi:CheY-like chemotaxis protein